MFVWPRVWFLVASISLVASVARVLRATRVEETHVGRTLENVGTAFCSLADEMTLCLPHGVAIGVASQQQWLSLIASEGYCFKRGVVFL